MSRYNFFYQNNLKLVKPCVHFLQSVYIPTDLVFFHHKEKKTTNNDTHTKIQYTSARPPDSEIHQFPQMSRQTTSSKRSLRRSLLNCHKQNQTSPKYPYKSHPSRTIIIRRKKQPFLYSVYQVSYIKLR